MVKDDVLYREKQRHDDGAWFYRTKKFFKTSSLKDDEDIHNISDIDMNIRTQKVPITRDDKKALKLTSLVDSITPKSKHRSKKIKRRE